MLSRQAFAAQVERVEATYAPLVPAALAYGIGRTQAFALAKAGHLKTFKIGRGRFVYLDSLRELPERLARGASK